MEFRMLGPLEVRGDDGPRPVRGRHHPKLLALLLDEANRVVPVDRLIAGLWDGTPPESARQQVQNVVAGLRRQLGTAGARLQTTGYGYRFAVATEELDLLRCRERETRAAGLRAEGRPAAAAAELRAALGEWRGPAFAGLEGRMVEAAARRLHEYRLALAENRIDIELELGADDALIAELRQLTADEPLRQRFTEQLMLALHRSGRAPEALNAYAELKEHLADTLGIDPGQSVRDLHTAILREDPELAAEPVSADGSLVTPALLPADIAAFTGRTDHLGTLDALLDNEVDDVKLAILTGTGGVGKTTLAVRWAHQVADRFPDGQLFVNLRGFDPQDSALAPDQAVRVLLDAMGVPHQSIPTDPEAQFGLYRSLLADRRSLVILDNAADAAQVRPLLPGGHGNFTLVTSRNPLHGLVAAQGAQSQPVRELSFGEACSLLERRLGKERVSAEPEAIERIIERCARLPLALAITAARAAAHPDFGLAALARELEDTRNGLDAFAGDDPATNVRTVFACSYRALNTEAAELFRLLGLHPGPDLTAPVAASLAAIPLRQARRSLTELAGAHLLTEHQPGRYTFHDLLHAYAAELLTEADDEADRNAATHRMFDHYVHTACLGSWTMKPDRERIDLNPAHSGVVPETPADAEQCLVWFARERQVLVRIIGLALDKGFDAATWQLAWAFAEFTYRRGHLHDGVFAQESALCAARRRGDVQGQIYSHRILAGFHGALRNPGTIDQHLRQALELCGQDQDRLTLAQLHLTLSQHHDREDRHDEAIRHGHRSLELLQGLGDERWEAKALDAVGWFYARVERYEEALDICERALALHAKFSNKVDQSAAWDGLGFIHQRQGHHREALECFRRALDLSRQGGHRLLEANMLEHLGDTYDALGDTAGSQEAWRKALGIRGDLGTLVPAQSLREKLRRLDRERRDPAN